MYFDLSIVFSLGAVLLALAFAVIGLGLRLSRLKKNPPKTHTQDATELLAELLKRRACVVVNVLDPDDFFLLSPKDR